MSGWGDYVEGDGSRRIETQGWEEGAVYEAGHAEESQAPIFALGQVQFTLPSALFSLACASNILVLACTGKRPSSASSSPASSPAAVPQVIRIDLDRPTEVDTIDIPLTAPAPHGRGNTPAPSAPSLHKVHVDPSGRHAVVSASSGDNFYIYLGALPSGLPAAASTRRAKPLSRLKGAIINAVAWSPAPSSSSFSTGEILLGTSTGQLLATALLDPALDSSAGGFSLPVPGRAQGSPERYVKQLFTLPERQSVVGLRYEVWSKRAAVVAATTTRVYQFVGPAAGKGEDGELLEAVLHPYSTGDVRPKTLELPGDPPRSELHFFAHLRSDNKGLSLPKSLAWLTGPGIYHGQLAFPPSSADLQLGDGIIDAASLIPYPTDPPSLFPPNEEHAPPISMALTEWHFVLLYDDKICAVDLLTDKVVYHELLDLPSGSRPVRLSTDPMRKTLWMHTEQSIYELVVRDEDRDVWKVYLARGQWENARKHAKTQRQRDAVLAAEADSYFAAGRYIQSAQAYAQSSKGFEEVVLRFVEKDERDALRYFLVAKLERLKRTDLTQRMMLATWLVEIFLAKINELEDLAAAERTSGDADNFHAERAIVEDDMRQFLATYKDNLDQRTVFELLSRHGRDELTLFYASTIGDHERIIQHHVAQEEWSKALQALAKQESLELYYRFAAVLVRHAPKEAVDAFLRQPRLDVRRLIPALTSPRARASTATPRTAEHLIRYLEHCVLQQGNTDSAVHNTLITLYATSTAPADSPADESAFLRFLEIAPSDPHTNDPYYDLDYALRVCRAHGRVQACVRIYSRMGMHESSVDLALEHDDVELAKLGADRPEDDELLRKKLWLKIAKHVVGKKHDIKTAMQFLESTNLLKIEDILPFFPDFVVIDDFKEEICSALEDYSAHIERLKEDMNEATRSAEAIKADIADLDNRFVVVDAGEKCGSCRQQLLTRQFYVFPCQHCFHADCLIQEVTKTLTPTQLRRMLDLQAQLAPSSTSAAAASAARQHRGRQLLDDTSAQGLKLAAASVQAVDQLRKLVLPDALLSAIGGAIPIPGAPKVRGFPSIGVGSLGFGSANGNGHPRRRIDEQAGETAPTARETAESREKQALRRQLDDLIASSCVLCEGAIAAVDRGFVEDGEDM
ncbi:tethering complex subunit PEP3 [Rhodotorula paludigena]|uniref:tethering complex subunit PEP3 n=1 Tax=Rhodotorula paludigena TaxID=86838 RepID=UPI003172D058